MSAHLSSCSAPSYEATAERDVMLPLRDGVRLATDIYFPARNGTPVSGKFPVILLRTPYDKSGQTPTGRFYAERGYIAAMQDVRGRYASEGAFYPFAHEGPDGFDAVEWLAAQPWCDGKVGTCGVSYEAAVQSALASLNPPHLAAMVVTFGPSSYFHSSMRQNGALELRFYLYAFTMAASSQEALADPGLKAVFDDALAHVWDWVKAAPIRKGETPLRLLPSYERWCLDILTRAVYDDYWKAPGYGPLPYYDRHADVPTLYIGGWYDTYGRGTVENFTALSRRQKTPVHMLMGPWHHGGVGQPAAGHLSFEPDGGLSHYESTRLQWFDQFLKGLPAGLESARPVRYFIMGGGEGLQASSRMIRHGGAWKSADTWPPPGTRIAPFYFHGDGSLAPRPPDGDSPPTRYTFDPRDPVPTIGGQLSAIPIPAGGFDQRHDARFPFCQGTLPLSARQDVLCFMTEPLEHDVTIAGPLTVKLWVSTDGPDTDFTAKLIDVYPPGPGYPDGCAINLADSILRLRFRNGFEREDPARPGDVYGIAFDLYPTANCFGRRHRIRVDISSSNYPRFDVNPNTGGPVGRERRLRVAENSLYHDAQRPSHILLPLHE